jgi:hypothetical protein
MHPQKVFGLELLGHVGGVYAFLPISLKNNVYFMTGSVVPSPCSSTCGATAMDFDVALSLLRSSSSVYKFELELCFDHTLKNLIT